MELDNEVSGISEGQRLVNILIKKGRGSFLRGWFRELDNGGNLEVSFHDFCEAAGRLGFVGDVYAVLGQDSDVQSLSLDELDHGVATSFYRFRDWAKATFGCSVEAYSSLVSAEADGTGHLTAEVFVSSCRQHGCKASDEELMEIFRGLDVDFNGYLTQPQFVYLEKDKQVRENARRAEKKKQKEKHLKLMAAVYMEDLNRGHRPTHRQAARPWLAQNFDNLPMLINKRRVEWQHASYEKSVQARIQFLRHLRTTYGNEVRAWRIGLDPDCNFAIDKEVVSRFCRKSDLKIDTAALWRSLDKDYDGAFRLEELCIRNADILASFQNWAIQEFGSCDELWDCPEIARITDKQNRKIGVRYLSAKKLLFTTFHEVLRQRDCPIVADHDMACVLLSSLDKHGCGFVERTDLQWLDKWSPPEWLCAEPDPPAWEKMMEMMLERYDYPLKAWRQLLDTDNSNNVSWIEFKEACRTLKFQGNIGGAWRVLNVHLASSISMKEYDAESNDLLAGFKNWADENFGSVAKAFKALDEYGTGYVTYPELRRACQKLKYEGDVSLLFTCLDIDHKMHAGKRCISLKDVEFLDEWEGDTHQEEGTEEFVVNEALSRKPARRGADMKTSTSLPSLHPRLLQNKSYRAHLPSDASSNLTGAPSSKMSSKDLLHQTYRCKSKLHIASVSPSTSPSRRSPLSPSSESPQSDDRWGSGKRLKSDLRKTRSLPWLHKWLVLDDEMQQYSDLQ